LLDYKYFEEKYHPPRKSQMVPYPGGNAIGGSLKLRGSDAAPIRPIAFPLLDPKTQQH